MKRSITICLFGTRATTFVGVLMLVLALMSVESQANLLTNGNFETGNLNGWTVFTTVNGTVGVGMPDIVYSDTSPGIYSYCARFNVGRVDYDLGGRRGGGIFQQVNLPAGNYTLSADTAMLDNRGSTNYDGGLFELLFDGVVVDSHDYEEAVLNVKEWANLTATLVGVTAGIHDVRIRMGRNYISDDVTPWQYIDNVTLVPEPATICLLGLGALSLLRKKRGV